MNVSHLHRKPPTHVALCRVTYRMTDQMGVVYYGNYMELFEMGRVELLRAAGVSYREMEAEGTLLPATRAECDYIHPARYDDLIEIRTRVIELSRARIQFGYEIVRHEDEKLIARGVTHHCFITPEGRAKRLPPKWHEILEQVGRGAEIGAAK